MALPRSCPECGFTLAAVRVLDILRRTTTTCADAAAKRVHILELHHVARKRVGPHGEKRRVDAAPVSAGKAVTAFVRAIA